MRVTNNPANRSTLTGNNDPLPQPKHRCRDPWESITTNSQRPSETVSPNTIVNTGEAIQHGNAIAEPSNPHSQTGRPNPAKTARDFLP